MTAASAVLIRILSLANRVKLTLAEWPIVKDIEGYVPLCAPKAKSTGDSYLSRHDCSRLFLAGKVGTVVIALASLTVPMLTVLLHTPTIHAQSALAAARKPAFDVVSIRPNESGNYSWSQSPLRDKIGRYRATNATLSALVSDYFGLKNESQIVGGPRWLGIQRFDIQAQVDGEPSRQELIRMVQSLMEDRFRLQFHRESRETPVYVLLAPKNGLTFGSHLAKSGQSRMSHGAVKCFRLPGGCFCVAGHGHGACQFCVGRPDFLEYASSGCGR